MAKLDKKWKKKTRTINDKEVVVYERTSMAKKYSNPNNKNSGKATQIVMQINPLDGMIRFVQRKEKNGGDITQNGKTYSDTLITSEDSFASSLAGGGTITTNGTLSSRYWGNEDGLDSKEKLITKAKTQILAQLKEDKQNKLGNGAGQILRKIDDGIYDAYSTLLNAEEGPQDDDSQTGNTSTNSVQIEAAVGRKVPKGRTESFYRYPLEVPDLGYDYIQITAYKYTAGGSNALSLSSRESAKSRIVKTSTKLETIVLPMQPNFSESNAVSWGGDNLNPIQAFAGRAAMGGIESIGNITDADAFKDAIGKAATSLGDDVKALLNDSSTGPALVAYFAGQAVGANLLGRTTGQTLNPNLELLFKGPNLRTFNFNFKFTPRNSKESQEVKEIIRVLKKNMAVQRSTSNLFLMTPNVFTVEYIYNSNGDNAGTSHPYLNKFKPMAMTNLNVNYTPDGTYMTYNGTGALTSTDLQMSFGELEPIYADEYDEEGFANHANMGY